MCTLYVTTCTMYIRMYTYSYYMYNTCYYLYNMCTYMFVYVGIQYITMLRLHGVKVVLTNRNDPPRNIYKNNMYFICYYEYISYLCKASRKYLYNLNFEIMTKEITKNNSELIAGASERIRISNDASNKIEMLSRELGGVKFNKKANAITGRLSASDVVDFLISKYEEGIERAKKQDLTRSGAKIKGASFLRVDKFVNAIMEYNKTAKEDLINLGNSFIRRETGGNAKVISKYLETHKEKIKAHNDKFGIDANTNIKFRIKKNYPREWETLTKNGNTTKVKETDKLELVGNILKDAGIYDEIRHSMHR